MRRGRPQDGRPGPVARPPPQQQQQPPPQQLPPLQDKPQQQQQLALLPYGAFGGGGALGGAGGYSSDGSGPTTPPQLPAARDNRRGAEIAFVEERVSAVESVTAGVVDMGLRVRLLEQRLQTADLHGNEARQPSGTAHSPPRMRVPHIPGRARLRLPAPARWVGLG